ncbi:hypothetical protein FRC04_010480 [Tulasnella sp. 424]|nr:hypothetical protein FRC04_010480 [Tulasnella sp. 424]
MSEALYSYARQCSLYAANTTVVQSSQTEGDLRTPQDSNNLDTIITSRDGHDGERRAAHAYQSKPVTKPNDGTGRARSRPQSSSSRVPRNPTVASARWSSYTSSLSPLSQLSPSPASDEVESLKNQLAASEAFVKRLTKEKCEAVDASRELWLEIKGLLEEHAQWLEERRALMGKLGLLDEAEATPGLVPSSGGHQVLEVAVSKPAVSGGAHSEPVVSEVDVTDDDETLARIGSIFLALTPVDDSDDCNTPSPSSTSTPSYFPTIDFTSSPSTSFSPPRAHRRSRQRGNAFVPFIHPDVEHATPLSAPVLRPSFNALGLPCTPDSPVHVLAPSSARLVSARAQVPRPQPDLIDLASQTVGSDPCPEFPGRRDLNDRAKLFLKEANAAAAAGSRPAFNLATGVELHAAMARVSASTARPRLASEFKKWPRGISEPQIRIEPIDPLAKSGFAALVRSKRKRPIPQLRARGFIPCSSPLANPPLTNPSESPEEEQNRTEISQAEPASAPAGRGGAPLEEDTELNCLSSSPLVNPPENAKQGQSKKRGKLGKLLKRVKSWISRSA